MTVRRGPGSGSESRNEAREGENGELCAHAGLHPRGGASVDVVTVPQAAGAVDSGLGGLRILMLNAARVVALLLNISATASRFC
jgi:hypothetical protein